MDRSECTENRMEPIRLTLQSGACTEIDSPHEGEEFGYVLSGRILLHLGDECHKVKKGESFYYPASCNHYLENPGKTPAIILWVSSPPYFRFLHRVIFTRNGVPNFTTRKEHITHEYQIT